jgi:hypothetical protein
MSIVLEPILTVSLGSALTVLLLLMTARLAIALRRFTIKRQYTAALSAPSVTVCIPARNETHALAECLERVLASDYKKIEIIVFDDNSTDDTSILVRSFAHAGVRFVPGVSLPAGWLGKNHALSILAREASGSKLVFLDVDTKIAPSSISQMVSYSLTEQVDMVSILPLRRDDWRLDALLTPLRYFWEILLSDRRAPATTSALWMVDRDVLLSEAGNFSKFAGDVRPEQRLAEQLGTKRYHFLIGTASLGVYQEKRWSSQLETSRRLLYPMVGMSLVAATASVALLLLMGAPLVGLVAGFVTQSPLLAIWSGCLFAGFASLYGVYAARIWQKSSWISVLLWQPLLIQEVCLMISSVIGYLTHTVTWKGRLVTAPVIQDDYIVIEK